MGITVIKPGLLGSIQDLGRYGYGSLGINSSGAMDRYAARVANLLVGNQQQEAVMELHFPGPQLLIEQNAFISITGGHFSPTLNDEPLPLWQPLLIRKNTILHFPGLRYGARCYIAIHGGFDIDPWLGSASTNLKAGAGGFKGRKFEKGDELLSREGPLYFAGWMKDRKDVVALNWRADTTSVYRYPHEIFFTAGHEHTLLTPSAAKDLVSNNFIIRPFSDRMGYRLRGPLLESAGTAELVSTGVSFGTIQLLPGGELIVLMADHQTTGGYPRIGHVITAHLPRLAQLRPSEAIQFTQVDHATAESLLFRMENDLQILEHSCTDHLNTRACKV